MSHRGNVNASRTMIFIFTLTFSDMPTTFFPDFLPTSGFREPRMSKEEAEKFHIYLGVPLCLNSNPSIVSPTPAGEMFYLSTPPPQVTFLLSPIFYLLWRISPSAAAPQSLTRQDTCIRTEGQAPGLQSALTQVS